MKRISKSMPSRQVFVIGTAAALLPIWSAAVCAEEKIFETNVTNDLTISSGEPEIAVDPRNPRNLAVIEFGVGSAKKPAYSYVPDSPEAYLKDVELASANAGRVMMSTDRGAHWKSRGQPILDPNAPPPRAGAGDPYIAYGPDGTLYVGGETGPTPSTREGLGLTNAVNIFVTYSTDGGKTFPPPQSAGTPSDRPWLAVDPNTGDVYTASTGTVNLATGMHNIAPGEGVVNDRWLVAWQPHLKGKSEPRRIGGPDFSGAGGSTITAAHGVIAATFVLGGPGPGGAKPAGPSPLPASLQGLVKDGTSSCSLQAPCLFFETSSDKGLHWTRHYVTVPGGFDGQRTNVTADPGRAGRYAIAVLNSARSRIVVMLTDDSGATWSGPYTVPETGNGIDFKVWMNYGPTGVLGLVWKKQRDDLAPPAGGAPAGQRIVVAPAFDVYSAISCDGGPTWLPSVRMNAETSPPGPAGHDDFSFIVLDDKYAHMVWGDRRAVTKVTNVPGGFGGIQAYYGRVPFATVSKGTACGRQK